MSSSIPKKPIINTNVNYEELPNESDDFIELTSIHKNHNEFISPRGRKSGTRICLKDLPSDLAEKLRHLDLQHDGYIDIEDIMVLDQKEQLEESTVYNYICVINIHLKYFCFFR